MPHNGICGHLEKENSMIEEIKLPEISENVDSGVVIEVLVKSGDFVEKEQPIVELETEKATFEVPSPIAGKVTEINVNEDDEVKVGQVILKIDTEAEATQKETETQESRRPADEQKDAANTTPEEPKATKELPPEKQESAARENEQAQAVEPPSQPARKEASASPAVRRLARELGIDISEVAISGAGNKVTQKDVKTYAKGVIAAGENRRAVGVTARALPDFSKWGQIKREKMSVTRKKIADTLSYAWSQIPHVTQYDQADITGGEQFRVEYSKRVEEAGGKLTITAILLKVVAWALKAFPKFNSSVDPQADEIILKDYCHISVAVDTQRGLLVPVICDVDKKTVLQLSVELSDLSDRTRNNKLAPDEMVGGNFTISNLGGIGGTGFSPIIYWPQVAILGIARACERCRYIKGEPQRRMILPLSLSYDHRIIDGSEGVRFLRFVVEKLEKPFLLAIDE
jgi:pyruvate dehydrogenase E2 component (dihydrolipoamide acetyltransferase)